MKIEIPYMAIHPYLLAIFPLLSFFSQNINEVGLTVIFIPFVTISLAAIIGYKALNFVLRNRHKAAMLTSILFFMFFSYGHFFNLLKYRNIAKYHMAKHEYLLPVWIILLLLGIFYIIRTQKNLQKVTFILNVVSVALVAMLFFDIFSFQISRKPWQKTKKDSGRLSTGMKQEKGLDDDKLYPDIYYIIAERYASSKSLEEYFGFDNSKFTTYLENKGFFVAAESRSNYLTTPPSLASSLNMDYLGMLTSRMGENASDKTPIYEMLKDYKAWRYLKSKGYKFIHFGATWGPTSHNDFADVNYIYKRTLPLSEFSIQFLKTTLLYPFTIRTDLLKITDSINDRTLHKNLSLDQIEKLSKISKEKGPKFVFAHLFITHKPYVFDQNGNYITAEEEKEKSSKENYINQLVFANKKIKDLVNNILSNSKQKAVVILQADEGPYPDRFWLNSANFNWKKATVDEIRQKTMILNAYLLPGIDKSVLYPSITPVNSFRLVFNLYFDENFPLLPDKTFAHLDEAHPYKFFDVTSVISH